MPARWNGTEHEPGVMRAAKNPSSSIATAPTGCMQAGRKMEVNRETLADFIPEAGRARV